MRLARWIHHGQETELSAVAGLAGFKIGLRESGEASGAHYSVTLSLLSSLSLSLRKMPYLTKRERERERESDVRCDARCGVCLTYGVGCRRGLDCDGARL